MISNDKLLTGRTALITGAGRNIGRSIALEMAQQGADIWFTDINEPACECLQQEIIQHGVDCYYSVADIKDTKQTDSFIQEIQQKGISIDILVNNVGITPSIIGIESFGSESFRQVFETNIFGPVYLTKQIVDQMIDRKCAGSIIFITSIHQSAISRWIDYSGSKAALQMMIEELAIDLAGYGIRVNGIAPGAIAEDSKGQPRPHVYTPLGQSTINPDYIGRAAVYLASDYFSRFTTGSILKIDAGLSLYNSRVIQHPSQRPMD